jgi:hypothetical protein
VMPSKLDRKRMDMLVKDSAQVEKVIDVIGEKMLILRGQGGSGKTVIMLQAAWQLYQREGCRTLFLTYNHALAADIRRLMLLLGVPSSPYEGGITVKTVMSFMYSWFKYFGLLEEEVELDFGQYLEQCKNCIELIKAEALSDNDIQSIIQQDPDGFAFNYITVDESQDWPDEEARLLKLLYGSKAVFLADGVDQLIRGERTNWGEGVSSAECITLALDKCLRMKRNLSVFIRDLSGLSSVPWNLKVNDKAGGGRVIIIEGTYTDQAKLQGELLDHAKENGNSEIDFLFCVPPSSVEINKGERVSSISQFLEDSKYQCWDGVDQNIRKDFPRSKNQFRIVQYESCRGLEGWTVVLEYLDEFWDLKKAARDEIGLSEEEELAVLELRDVSRQNAYKRVIMAMSRAIDTLVITVRDFDSDFSKLLLDIARKNTDYVEVIR